MIPEVRSLEKRLPHARWFMVTVTFAAADTDTVISHKLVPRVPTDVRFEVVDQNVGGIVYRGQRLSGADYIVLRATLEGTYRIRLFIEAYGTGEPLPLG